LLQPVAPEAEERIVVSHLSR